MEEEANKIMEKINKAFGKAPMGTCLFVATNLFIEVSDFILSNGDKLTRPAIREAMNTIKNELEKKYGQTLFDETP